MSRWNASSLIPAASSQHEEKRKHIKSTSPPLGQIIDNFSFGCRKILLVFCARMRIGRRTHNSVHVVINQDEPGDDFLSRIFV